MTTLILSALLATQAIAGSAFQPNSPIPAQLQGQILDATVKACGAAEWSEASTNTYEAAGETYFETALVSGAEKATVYSGIARLGGFGVINVDCAKAAN